MSFEIQTGINISHWLSQSSLDKNERKKRFTPEDVRRIADIGFDHVRLPVDEIQIWDENGFIDKEAVDLLNEAIYWCSKENIRSIVDMHILRSHHFNDVTQPKLYTDPDELHQFTSLWIQLSEQISEWSNDFVAYEILNEPKAQDPNDWNRVSSFVLSMLRKKESYRTMVLGSNWYCKADTFDVLNIPDDKNLMLTFHFYDPMLITHHNAMWTNIGGYDGQIKYPGNPVNDNDIQSISEPLRQSVIKENYFFNRDTVVDKLRLPLEVREKTGRPVFCGEFGCIKKTPIDVRRGWYKDIISVFKEYKIPFTHWDYKGEFGIFDSNYNETGIIDILHSKYM